MSNIIGTIPDFANEDEDQWVDTEHDRVFYRTDYDRWNRGEYELAKFIANRFEEWSILLTMGPYRPHDFYYEVHPDYDIIHIDCYSASMVVQGPRVPHRRRHPVEEHHEAILEDLRRIVGKHGEDQEDSDE